VRARPFDPITGLLRPSASELNRVAHEAARAGSLLGPNVVSGGMGLHAVPPERSGLVLAKILSVSPDTPYRYEWGAVDVSPADRTVGEHVAGAYNGFQDAGGDWNAPAVDPADADSSSPRAAGDVVWLQWDEASRFWLIVGAPAAATDRVMLRLLTGAIPYSPNISAGNGYPARVQQWATTGPADVGHWADASSTTVYVRDPNGTAFRPGEYVEAVLVGTYNASGLPGGVALYERTGLDGLYVSGTGTNVPTESWYPFGQGYPETRFLQLNDPLYTERPDTPEYPGKVNVWVAPSSAQDRGILLAYPENAFGAPPLPGQPSNYDPNDPWRQSSVCQWARGGSTGFTALMTNGLTLSDGAPPGSGGGLGQTIGRVPPDSAFNTWSSGGWVYMAGGSGRFALSVNNGGAGGNGFQIDCATALRGNVVWGQGFAGGTYQSFTVNASTLHLQAFAPPVGDAPLLDVTGSAGMGNSQTGYCWVSNPRAGGLTAIGTQSANLTFPVNQGTALLSANNYVQIGGVTILGVGQFSQTRMVAQNYVSPPGAIGAGAPGANLALPAGTPNSTGGFAFYNGIYLGGLEWIWSLRQNPTFPVTPPMLPPIDVHIYPSVPPPTGPTYPTLNGGGYWTTMQAGYA
jgi:hypothetical protein